MLFGDTQVVRSAFHVEMSSPLSVASGHFDCKPGSQDRGHRDGQRVSSTLAAWLPGILAMLTRYVSLLRMQMLALRTRRAESPDMAV